jgi:Family of unknown function (DUF6527)
MKKSRQETKRDELPFFTGVIKIESHNAARDTVKESAQNIAVVYRNKNRSVLFQCPCGCGEILVVNVDPDAGRAWKVQVKGSYLTLSPSVRRTTGCKSHFIVWRSQVLWCSFWDDDNDEEPFEQFTVDSSQNWWETLTREKKHKKK